MCFTSGDLRAIARRYCGIQGFGQREIASVTARLGSPARPPEDFCRAVADYFEKAPRLAYGAGLGQAYATFKRESMSQYRALTDAGLLVEPWLGRGQPYANSRDLCEQVSRTAVLRLFLTRRGHGPVGDDCFHPLREPANLRIGAAELAHNDIFRAIHDVFGHVMLGATMGPSGEFLASYCHLIMYSPPAHPVLFAEQISQVCWFFYGPHLRDPSGRLPSPGDRDWIPLRDRPYPEQKVFPCPQEFIDEFMTSFRQESP